LSFQSLSLVPPQGGDEDDEDEGEQQEADVEVAALAT
jgi:hypothetical protein